MKLALLLALSFAAVRRTRQMLGTNVSPKPFVTLGSILVLHFIQ
jgi:hypothetical protein